LIVVEEVVMTVPPTTSVGELTPASLARRFDVQQHGWATAERLSFAVEEESAGTGEPRLIANVALKLLRREHGHAEVGYWTAAPGWGRGIAPRALDALSTWTFRTFSADGVASLAALHDVRNGPSCRVAEKAGYRFVRALSAPAPSSGQGHLHVRAA
jgi:RimJ/RimL family protein N-acetyltransferase